MPKLKTRKSLVKRFKITKTGKILRRQASGRHLKTGKSKKRLRNLKRTVEVTGFYAKKIHKATGK
ncbi:MAG: 50S ribosomal protein L35 [bacterium]|nr:50S ribosomal protein L35 [bacterium]